MKKFFFFLVVLFFFWIAAGFIRTCHAQNFDFPDTVNGWHWWSWGGSMTKVWSRIVDDGTAIEGKMCQAFGYELPYETTLNWFEWKKDLGFSFPPSVAIGFMIYLNDFTLAPGIDIGAVYFTLWVGSDTAWYVVTSSSISTYESQIRAWIQAGNSIEQIPKSERLNRFRIKFRIYGLTMFEMYLDKLISGHSPTSYDLLDRFGDPLIVGVPSEKEEIVPRETKLFQNYPNPFNPATSIKYTVASIQYIKLAVYDILGREVATLVNEEKPAGEHSVSFDGGNLPSGVYFYTLRAGSFSETKKMILVK